MQMTAQSIDVPQEQIQLCSYCGDHPIFYPHGKLCDICEGRFDDHEYDYDDDGEADNDFI